MSLLLLHNYHEDFWVSCLALPQERAYQLLQDPEVLARCMPGCEALVRIGENEYQMKMKMALASFSGIV